MTAYRNDSGGRVAVVAAPLDVVRPVLHVIDPFRQPQLINFLTWLDVAELPVLVDTDADLYVLVGDLPDDAGVVVYALNLHPDPVPIVLKLRRRQSRHR